MTRSLLTAICSLAILALIAPAASAATITVPTDQPTIQAAVTAASPYDTIYILNGTHTVSSTVHVNKPLTITGESEAGVTIQIDTGASWGFRLGADDITFEYVTLQIISTTAEGGYPIHASATDNIPAGYDNLTIQHITVQGDATSTPKRRSGVDVHGYNNVILDDIDSRDASYGNGINLTGCNGVSVSNITTADNAWGSIAVYVSGPSYFNQPSTNVTIDGSTLSLGEDLIYIENEHGLVCTNIVVTGYDYEVYNDDFRPTAEDFIFLRENLAAATGFALGFPAFVGYESASSIRRISDGHWFVANGMSIQTAVDDATAGDTVEVLAGTFVEQVEIAKDLTLDGAGMGTTTVQAYASMPLNFVTSAVNVPIFYVHDADAVVIREMTVDGAGMGNSNVRFYGVAYRNAGGGVHDCEIKDVRNNPLDGSQHGNAFYLYNNDTVARSMDVTGCVVYGFQKNGITLNSLDGTPLAVNVDGNDVTGAPGLTADNGDPAQNGIQLWGELITGAVNGNTITDIAYDNTNATTKWVATTILDYYSSTSITSNMITGAHMGIYKYDAAGTIANNDITIEKIGVYAWGIIGTDPPRAVPQPFDAPASGKTSLGKKAVLNVLVDGNTVAFVGPDNTSCFGIEGDAGYGADDIAFTVTNNIVTGFEAGVDIWQCQSSCDTGVFTSVNVNNNSFSGNTYGVRSNVGYLTVDATCNWWGDVAGPNAPFNPSPGDAVQGDVLWYPWLDDTITGSPACVGLPNPIAADPPAGVEITPCDPCLTVPVDFTNNSGVQVRGMSVTFELSAELDFCSDYSVDIVPTYGTGSWADGYTAGSEVVDQILDNGDGTYTVDRAILGSLCGPTAGGSLFTVGVTNAAAVTGDATGTITILDVTVRDCANAPITSAAGGAASIDIDQTAPDAVTDLVAVQVKSGNDSDGTTKIDLSWTAPTDPDAATVTIWRKGFGFYPEYDDLGGAAPAATTDPAGDGWTMAGTVPAATTTYQDEPGGRDFWYYVAVADDGCLDSPVSNMTGGTLNYHLGDVAPPPNGNNLVYTGDISALGAGYGTIDGDTNYDAKLDVGPTTDYSVDALPTTDNQIQFEDLMMFAINFDQVSKGAPAPAPAAFNEVALSVVDGAERVSVEIHLSGDGTLQGVSVPLRWNSSAVRPVGFSEGSFMTRQGRTGMVLSPEAGTVDAALMGVGQAGLSGDGLLAVVHFERVGAGDAGIMPGEIVARDSENLEQSISGTVVAGTPEGATPKRTVLHSAYPNPFNPRTTLSFALAQPGHVRLAVYSLSGRLVSTLVDEEMPAGEHQVLWTGLDTSGVSVSSGTYLVRMVAPGKTQSQRVTLLK